VLRRTGRPAQARDLLLFAASAIEPGHRPTPGQLSVYGTLLEVAAYTAAVDGNRHAAAEYIGEAAAAARLGSDANHRFTAFGPSGVILYQVSVAQVLGDSGTAIDVLVNNAGRSHVGAPEETTDAELRDLFEVHVFGPAALVRAVLPHMRSRRSGSVVQISSMGGQTPSSATSTAPAPTSPPGKTRP
jgi:NAD(P)-dependent dehydrogenase (short-subunit alcohol dehydrogenase family)